MLRGILSKHYEVLEFYGLSKPGDPKTIHLHDSECVKNCDFMIAECSYPSLGLGYEIALALQFNKPVVAIAQNDANVSRMIEGIQNPLFKFRRYKTMSEIPNIITSLS